MAGCDIVGGEVQATADAVEVAGRQRLMPEELWSSEGEQRAAALDFDNS